MTLLRLVGVGVFALAALGIAPATAGAVATAEPPPNDDYTGAVALTTPASIQLDTSGATRGVEDERAEGACSWWTPITVHNSVYYTLAADPARDRSVRLSTAGSGYDARIAVFRNFPGGEYYPTADACGRQTVDVALSSLEDTYTVVVYQPSADAGGGNLQLTVSETPAPVATVKVDRSAKLSTDGKQVTLSGTVTCNQACVTSLTPKVTQGRAVATGYASDELAIDGTWKWSTTADVTRGSLRPGPATVEVAVSTLFSTGNTEETFTTRVRLTR